MITPPAAVDLEPLKTWFVELDRQQTELQRYLEERFGELDLLRADLERLERELSARSEDLDRREAGLDASRCTEVEELQSVHQEQLVALQKRYDAVQSELAGLREQMSAGAAAAEESYRKELAELTREKSSLESELESARSQVAELTAAVERSPAGDPSAVQLESQLTEVRVRLEEAVQNLAAKEEQIASLQRDRSDLEAELDAVRTRAAELSDTLDQMKREAVEERAEWSAELKQMRRVLERQAALLAAGASQPAAAPAAVLAASAPRKPNGKSEHGSRDPVLGSVVAQFDQIRRERAQHRMQRAEGPA